MNPLSQAPSQAPKQTPTLQEVSAHFDHWRSTRKNRTTPAPDSLASAVSALVGRYPDHQILKKLLITKHQLQSYRIKGRVKANPEETPPAFIKLSPLPESSLPSIKLHHPSGVMLSMESLSEGQFSSLLQTLLTTSMRA
jgi:hypothetical protein